MCETCVTIEWTAYEDDSKTRAWPGTRRRLRWSSECGQLGLGEQHGLVLSPRAMQPSERRAHC
jgi:hypothetical protein